MGKFSGVFSLSQATQAIRDRNWTNVPPPSVEYLVVAGGGGGGSYGGGGAGGLLVGSIAVPVATALTVTVGGGGSGATGQGNNGSNSVFGSIVSTGGGGGGAAGGGGGKAGGSGGGAGVADAVSVIPGQGISGQGNAGGSAALSNTTYYPGGGGGGAGTVGLNSSASGPSAGNGGAGIASDISGSRIAYAGGGAGGAWASASGSIGGLGGVGGGGNGGSNTTTATAGTTNTGGGGGAIGIGNGSGSAGGSGVVIISYPDIYAAPASTTGSPTVSTSGSGSIAFNGTNQALIYPSSTNYAFGTGDFTVEMFIYRSNTGGILLDARSGALSETWAMYCKSATKLGWYTGPIDAETPSDIPLNSWAHIAVCRSGTTTRLFINGVLETSFTDTTNYTTTSTLKIGRNAGGGYSYFGGNMSNIRITKGVALYTSGFTVPSAPLSRSASTGLLLSAVSGSTYVDFSGNATITTAENSPLWSSSSPFATGLGYKNRVYTWTSSGSITF